jgi:hypothetical protein
MEEKLELTMLRESEEVEVVLMIEVEIEEVTEEVAVVIKIEVEIEEVTEEVEVVIKIEVEIEEVNKIKDFKIIKVIIMMKMKLMDKMTIRIIINTDEINMFVNLYIFLLID